MSPWRTFNISSIPCEKLPAWRNCLSIERGRNVELRGRVPKFDKGDLAKEIEAGQK
jgi:hypothetical protein